MIQSNAHSPFRLGSLEELQAAARRLGLDVAIEEDTSYLVRPAYVAGRTIPNSMAVQPMEGCDGTREGAPDVLTFRRYERFGAGGAGLIWFEACAVVEEGRANPRQLWIRPETKNEFARLLEHCKRAAAKSMGAEHVPFTVLQLTHSGRYSRPRDEAKPIIAHHDPILDAQKGLPPDYPLITDNELEALEDRYVEAARLAYEVGFDAVDIKSCHRYLVNELLAAHTREGRYGGSYENRTRFLKNIVGKIRAELGSEVIITCRLGVYDAHPYPYGWGVRPDPGYATMSEVKRGPDQSNDEQAAPPDLEEPKRLVRELFEMGLPLINITMGNPYHTPHVNRPYDRPIEGWAPPKEHPLVGVARMIDLTREIQRSLPEIVVVGSGYSWLRDLWPYVAAANIRDGAMRIVGLGRQAFAYPGFAKEIIETGRLARRHTCITCSSCTQIMRDGGRTGCVPFDRDIYGPIYREGRRNSLEYKRAQASRCRDCFDATCVDGCPAGVDIPGFVRALADGDIRRSYEILRRNNALPEICGYICPAEVQCEGQCIENVFSGEPVPIKELQQYVCRTAREKGWIPGIEKAVKPPRRVGRIAVIGAGPAGLACTLRLLELGHHVELFDIRKQFGGTAVATIPSRRLSGEAFEQEVRAILGEKKGDTFTFHCGEGLSDGQNLEWFCERFNAVFLAVGLPRGLALSEKPIEGVEDALDFLERAKLGGAEVPERVAVLGGGNTAMDAATQALACGARDVYIIYRRSYAEMPAWPSSRKEALEMGAHLLMLTQPLRYRTDEAGRVNGVVIARTVLGEPDDSGRRSPIIIPNSETVLEVDLVVEAIGQGLPEGFERLVPGVELTENRLIKVDTLGRTSRKGVFAGGDATNGGGTAVEAIAHGMRAAQAIHDYLQEL